MKPYKRRQESTYPYYKLATFDPVSLTFRDGKTAYPTAEDALADTKTPGRYRISAVFDNQPRDDLAPFTIT